jgi:hypothetical protein
VWSNEHIIEMEWAKNGGVSSANNWECHTIAHNDEGKVEEGDMVIIPELVAMWEEAPESMT